MYVYCVLCEGRWWGKEGKMETWKAANPLNTLWKYIHSYSQQHLATKSVNHTTRLIKIKHLDIWSTILTIADPCHPIGALYIGNLAMIYRYM